MTANVEKKRVAVMISGRGSNMMVLIDAANNPQFPAQIVLVLSNKSDAAGLDFARTQGIASIAIEGKDYANREAHEAAIHEILSKHRVDLICLAGYMRILTEPFVQKWRGKILNIHPSLLPGLPGLNTHQRALDADLQRHGCTVHFVTGELDAGPIIAQSEVPVLNDDDADTLAARVLDAEHLLYPQALEMVARDGGKEGAS